MDGILLSLGNGLCLKQCCIHVLVTNNIRYEWNHGKSIKSISTLRKTLKSHVLISHLKTLLSCIKQFIEGSHHFQVNVKCLGIVHDVFCDLVSSFLLCFYVLLLYQCAFSSLVVPAFSVSSCSAFLCYSFAYVFPFALFHVSTPRVQATESSLTNYWKLFLFLPCYCNTVRPPCTFLMLS